ncbi:MAG TPA: globin [Longimicrobiales bacterium]|nr:globin [Longimicrobiales bacterium]
MPPELRRTRVALGEATWHNGAMIGEDTFTRLVAAFYRQVPHDDILGPMYPPDDMEGAEERLRDFLIGRFGGPQRYIEKRGHPRLRMRHAPFPIDTAAAQRWLQLMDNALREADLPPEADATLREFFAGVAAMMINRPG